MEHLVIVDHALFAEGLSLVLQKQTRGTVIPMTTDPSDIAPSQALVLIELFLPDNQCGLQLARQIQQQRLDLTPIVWTAHPAPIHIWAGIEYQIPGFLDKNISLLDLYYWSDHATAKGSAWPGNLLAEAREWAQEIAPRLRGLSQELWLLWSALLQGSSNTELASQLKWSKRTIERRLTELYILLGVQSRSQAINAAWQWGLVKMHRLDLIWFKSAIDLLCIPASTNAKIRATDSIQATTTATGSRWTL